MKKINLTILVLMCIYTLVLPVVALENHDSDDGISFTDQLKVKESYDEGKKSDLNAPVSKMNNFIVYVIICLLFLALAIGLVKYIYGNSSQSSDGLMHMGKVVLGVAAFIFCGIMAFAILSMK